MSTILDVLQTIWLESGFASIGWKTIVMLVLACGLMVAIVAFWRIDLSHIQDSIDRDRLQEIENAEELIDSGELGESFESIGTAFTDPETGKVYIIKP